MLAPLAVAFLLAAPAPACDLTLCMAGAFTRTDGANPRLARICRAAPGLVEDCGAAGCQPLFAFASIPSAQAALFKALDANADGTVDAADPARRVCLVGYSWGGVNAALLARQVLTDPRIAPARRQIAHLVLVDPFAPMTPHVEVPGGVQHAVNHRHTLAPPRDCSRNAPLGPYKGLMMRCPKGASCVDVDHSKRDPTVGHCSIMRTVAPAIRALISPPTPPAAAPPTARAPATPPAPPR